MASNDSVISNFLTNDNFRDLVTTLNKIFPLFTVIFGTIGACISFTVFCDKRFTSTSFTFYNLVHCILDLLVFYIGYFRFIFQSFYIDPLTISIFWCKFFSFTIRPILQVSIWIQLMMTLDRYLFIHYPNRYNFIRQTKNQIKLAAIFLIMFIAVNLPVVLFYGYYGDFQFEANKTTTMLVCYIDLSQPLLGFATDISFLFLFCIIPFFIMLYLTISMSITFISMKKRVQRISKEKKREYRFAFSVIFQNILFLIFTLPFSFYLPLLSSLLANFIKLPADSIPIMNLSLCIFTFLIYFYFATKFIINFTFNSLFREILIEKLKFLICIRKAEPKNSN